MTTISFSNKPIVNDVFRFMAIRNPQRASQTELELGTVSYRMENATDFLDDLASIRNDGALGSKDKRVSLFTRASAFKQGSSALPDSDALEAAVPSYRAFFSWLHEHAGTLVAGDLEAAWPTLTPLGSGQKQDLWDNLLALLLTGGSSSLREGIMEILVADHFLLHYGNESSILEAEALGVLLSATLVLPGNVFPIPKIEIEVESSWEPPTEDEDAMAARERWSALNTLMPALEDEEARQLNLWRRTAQQLITEIDGESSSSFAGIVLEEAFVGSRPSEEKVLLGQLHLEIGDELEYALQVLEKESHRLSNILGQSATPGKRVVLYGGAIWNVTGKHDDSGATLRMESETEPEWNDFNAKLEPGNSCGVRPMGVADLKKVEQKLCCYAPGEVAHIENILQGEYKERSTRRLKRREETFVSVTEREKMDERDSITTERFELNKETAEVIQQDTSMNFGASVTAIYGAVTANITSQFSTSTSTTQSDALSSTYAKDVTERALQRITERVREEHYLTLIEEYEENNKHGLDNRAGTKHVVGLYRWADKIYEAKVVNYGKRLMMEFMIPEPAYFHTWAMSQPDTTTTTTLVEPYHPSSLEAQQALGVTVALKKPEDLHPWNYSRWAAAYGAKVAPAPREVKIAQTFAESSIDITLPFARSYDSLKLPAGYKTISAKLTNFQRATGGAQNVRYLIGNYSFNFGATSTTTQCNLEGETDVVPFACGGWAEAFAVTIVVRCKPTDETYQKWQNETYDAILSAYQAKKDAFDEAMANAMAGRSSAMRASNPALLRGLEQAELKKGCVEWLFKGQDYSHDGIAEANEQNPCSVPQSITSCDTLRAGERAKFMEHSFEWRNITYDFYPYFWAGKCRWKQLYRFENADPVFLSFLQAGMARVLVPVRPGHEQAVLYFLQTGQIWNGGMAPSMDIELYRDYVRDISSPVKNDKNPQTWELRVPTTLTALQCESGCVEGTGLPCDCGTGIGRTSYPMVGLGQTPPVEDPHEHAEG
jgi:hypothetical protein